MQQPKLEDLARICQVNKATVSRALNRKKGVSEKKRENIIKIAKDLGFQPNTFASALAGGQKYSILVLFQDFEFLNNEYYGRLYLNLVKHLNQAGYALTTSTLADNQYKKIIQQHLADGVILLNSNHFSEVIEICRLNNVPLAGIGNGFKDFCDKEQNISIPVVSIDNISAGREAAKYLISIGVKEFIFVTATGIQSFKDRQSGFVNELNKLNKSIKILTLNTISYNSHQYVKETTELFESLPTFDYSNHGIFCANDDIGLGVYKFFENKYQKLICPLLCFDNTFIAEHTGKGISSFEQNIEEISKQCVNNLLLNINSPKNRWVGNKISYLDAKIILRDSTNRFQNRTELSLS